MQTSCKRKLESHFRACVNPESQPALAAARVVAGRAAITAFLMRERKAAAFRALPCCVPGRLRGRVGVRAGAGLGLVEIQDSQIG